MFFFGIPYTHVFTLEPGTLLSHTLKKNHTLPLLGFIQYLYDVAQLQ